MKTAMGGEYNNQHQLFKKCNPIFQTQDSGRCNSGQDSVCSQCCWGTSAAVQGQPTAACPSLAGGRRIVLTAIKTSAINCAL